MKRLRFFPAIPSNIVFPCAALIATCFCALAPPPATPAPTTAAVRPAGASLPAWERDWNATVTAARQEGKVVIYGVASPEMRDLVGKTFTARFGIPVEWFTGRANEVVARIISERRSGIYVPDVLTDATMSNMNLLKPTGALEDLKSKLVLPEVTDTSKWFQGRLWWVDKEHTHLAYLAIPMPAVLINTEMVKPHEIKSYNDLLDARWKGKMVIDDPSQGGSGNSWVTAVGALIMNDDYLRKLARQEPVVLRDMRQEVEWVARGKYPVGVGMSPDEIITFKRVSAPIDVITPREGTYLSLSRGGISLLKQAPHPNAAKVYLNWALSQEGQRIIAKAEGSQSARIDVPTDFVDASALRRPEYKYFDTITFEYQLKKQEYVVKAKEIFAAVLPK